MASIRIPQPMKYRIAWARCIVTRSFAVLSCFVSSAFIYINAQEIVYPSTPQISKNGTAALLENYASLPLSGRGGSITDFDANVNLTDQLARPTFLRSEPSEAPLSSSRFFVCDMNRNLYILDKSNRTFTPYITERMNEALSF